MRNRPARRLLLALPALLPLGPAAAQAPMLYEQRLPEGTGFIRYVNALPEPVALRPAGSPVITLGTNGADRVSSYRIVENLAGRTLEVPATAGERTATLRFQGAPGGLVTVLVQRAENTLQATAVTDQPEYNQLRAKLSFYNALPAAAPPGWRWSRGGQAVFSGVPANAVRTRTINPAQATVRAACGPQRAAPLDLGRLQAGGQYSVWLMAPGEQPIAFTARDFIAAPGT